MSDSRTLDIDISLVGDAAGTREPRAAASAAGLTNIFDFDRAS